MIHYSNIMILTITHQYPNHNPPPSYIFSCIYKIYENFFFYNLKALITSLSSQFDLIAVSETWFSDNTIFLNEQ